MTAVSGAVAVDVATARRRAVRAHTEALTAAQGPGYATAGVQAYLLRVLDSYGVTLDEEAVRCVRWLAGWDADTTGQVAGLLALVAEARGPMGPEGMRR